MTQKSRRLAARIDALRGAIAMIDEHGQANIGALVAHLEETTGLRLTEQKPGGAWSGPDPRITAAMLTVRVSTTGTTRDALQLWARAARRKLLELGA